MYSNKVNPLFVKRMKILKLTILLVLMIGMSGCASRLVVQEEEYGRLKDRRRVIVTLKDGMEITLRGESIRFEGDFLFGNEYDSPRGVMIKKSDIEKIEVAEAQGLSLYFLSLLVMLIWGLYGGKIIL